MRPTRFCAGSVRAVPDSPIVQQISDSPLATGATESRLTSGAQPSARGYVSDETT